MILLHYYYNYTRYHLKFKCIEELQLNMIKYRLKSLYVASTLRKVLADCLTFSVFNFKYSPSRVYLSLILCD